ncbi:MAG TPA: SCO2322 family protein [Pedococcus sp.]|jgi:hypothetical protein|nr:SCO2322 family protein [Pedococcus sp.]
MSRTTLRPSLAALSLIAALFVALVAPAGAANAAAYRFWGYFQLKGTSWQFATKGPDQLTPANGSVEGWRFAVAGDTETRAPRVTPTFDAICGATKADSAHKRVAVVIDYGRPADQADGSQPPAPVGRCASVAPAATGAEVLAAVATVRSEKGLVCGVDNRPATGCGDPVKQVSAAAAAPDTHTTLAPKATSATTGSSGSGAGHYAGIGVVVLALLALGGVLLRRRVRPVGIRS